MGDLFPRYPDEVEGGDEPTYPPKNSADHSLLAAERGTQQTRRLETDENNNLYVNVAEGDITVTVGEVEVKNDTGNPIPVSDAGASLTVDGTVAVSNFPASVEVSNDAGNPLPVSGTVTANAGTGPFPVSDNGGSLTIDGSVSVLNFPATQNVAVTSSVEVEVKNDSGNPVPVNGTVTANQGTAAALSSKWPVQLGPSTAACYSLSTTSVTVAATATDVFTISGSGTKTVRILRVEISAIATVSAISNWLLVKRSSANSGGTLGTTPTLVPWDSNSAAATVTAAVYTANPSSLGTSVGTLRRSRICQPATTAEVQPSYLFDFTDGGMSSGLVLRGTSEFLCINFNGAATPTGLSAEVNIDWIEE